MFYRLCLSTARLALSFILLSGLLSFPSPSVQAKPPQPLPSQSPSFASDHVLVKLRSAPLVSSQSLEHASTGSPSLDRTLLQAGGRRLKSAFAHPLPDVKDHSGLERIFRVDLRAGQSVEDTIALLSADPSVEYAEPDYLAQKIAAPNDPQYAQQWGLAKIQAEGAWDLTFGSPTVIIAVVDSGIDLSHEDLVDNLWINPGEIPANGIDDDNNGFIDDLDGWNFIASSNDLWDDNGHGTLVAGIAAATSNNAKGIAGVCGLCRIMPVKVMQPSGSANYSDIAAGINYAVVKGARVINLSLGGYANSKALQDAVNNALAQNIVVVAGSGNDNTSNPFYPAAYPGVISVAATDSSDHKANFSNYGSWVKVSAPGVDVLTTALGGDYLLSSGTSQSSPFVSGLAGLLVTLHPDWTPAMVLGQITHTVDAIDALNPGLEGKLGVGRINATKALQPAYPILTFSGFSANGTANGRPDFNADASLSVSLANDWADALGVSATLSTTDPTVTVTTPTADLGDILSGQMKSNPIPFAIHIAPAAGYNHAISFKLDVTANGGAYTKSFSFTVSTRSSVEDTFGTIADDTLWTNDKTYKITGNVGVAPGVTLTIQPGTVVQFAGNFAFNVAGTLIANGTASQPILFEPFTTGQTWSRISIDDLAQDGVSDVDGNYVSGTSLTFVTIQGASSGLQCTNSTPRVSDLKIDLGGISCTLGSTSFSLPNSSITGNVSASGYSSASTYDYQVSGTTISGSLSLPDKSLMTGSHVSGTVTLGAQSQVTLSTTGPISIASQSQVTFSATGVISTGTGSAVEDNTISGSLTLGGGTAQRNQVSGGDLAGGTSSVINQNVVSGGGISAGNASTLTGNSVENSPTVGLQAGTGSTVTGNRIVGAVSHGISVSTGTISGNLVANITGDGLRAGAADIENNTFTGIKGNGVYLNGIPVKMEGNNFEFNTGTYDLYNDNPAGQYTLAPRNWWGTTTTATIRSRVYDFNLDMYKGRVTFSPILTGPSQTAPAYVRSVTLDPPSPVGIQTVNFTVQYSRPMDVTRDPKTTFGFPINGTWKIRNNMPTARSNLGVTATTNGKIYAIGGFNGTVLANVEEYDPETNSWATKTKMPTARSQLGVVTASNGKIYAIGGYSSSGPVATVEEYDPSTDTWTTKSSMQNARWSPGVTNFNNGKIYVIGGGVGAWLAVSTVEEYDPTTDIWTPKADVPTARGLGAAISLNNKIYFIGGFGDTGSMVANVDEYDPIADTWTPKASMTTARLGFASSAAMNGNIYAIGGVGAPWSVLSSVDEYDPNQDAWVIRASMPTPRNYLSAAISSNNRIYAIGGEGSSGEASSVVEEFTPGLEELTTNGQWLDSIHYQTSYEFNSLIRRDTYKIFIQGGMGLDGLAVAPYQGASIIVDYAGYISVTTPPITPVVSAWGDGSLTTLSAYWIATDPNSAITGYRYAIGTTPGGVDVVNWTNVSGTSLTRTGLNLTQDRNYYISIKARNEGGLWSLAGSSNAVKNGIASNNPQPHLSQLNLTSVSAGSAATLLTITGSNFILSSIVRWNSIDLTTTYVDSTHLIVTLPASLLTTPNTATITVFNLSPGGGSSNGLIFTITSTNPQPQLTQLSIMSIPAGSDTTLLTITGSNFIPGSIVRWNGTDLFTTYVDSAHLTVTLPASLLTPSGSATITIFNPAPGGGSSNGLTFTITSTNPQPQLTQLSLTSIPAGSDSTTLTIIGSNFIPGSILRWNGADLSTTYVDSTHLTVILAASLLMTPGFATITVFNPEPGGGSSSGLTLTILGSGDTKYQVFLPATSR